MGILGNKNDPNFGWIISLLFLGYALSLTQIIGRLLLDEEVDKSDIRFIRIPNALEESNGNPIAQNDYPNITSCLKLIKNVNKEIKILKNDRRNKDLVANLKEELDYLNKI